MPRKSTARIYRPTPVNLTRLAAVLARGGLVALPSETVYGLAGDALDAAACRAIFRAKRRPAHDPLIVHVASLAQAREVAELSPAALKVAASFWPGPLTLVLPKKPVVPGAATSGLPSVAVRMPAHRLFRRLIKLSGRPLAAPSANPFGYVSPTTAAHVKAGLGASIGHILDGGPCPIGVESTILDLRDSRRPALLRPGAISREQLEAVLGLPIAASDGKNGKKKKKSMPSAGRAEVAPGMLERHYSPHTPLKLMPSGKSMPWLRIPADEAILLFRRPSAPTPRNVFWLTTAGQPRQAANRLFALLRKLDAAGWKKLHAELAPGDTGLCPAINDRLTRAAAKRG